MTNLQYKEMVLRALESLDNTSDSVDAVRKILSSCGVEFPYGLCESILDSLSNNKLAQWRSCTLENAAKSANNGIVTIGINNEKVVVIIPDSDDVDKSEFVCRFYPKFCVNHKCALSEISTLWVYFGAFRAYS